MLIQFFVIAILTALVKSEDGSDEIGWICPAIGQWGNCSYQPNVPQLLRMIEVDSTNNRYPDIYFCPNNIVKRHAICVEMFYKNCYEHLTIAERSFFSANSLNNEDEPYCPTDRPYKKEFIEHMACMKGQLNSNGLIKIPFEQLQQLLEFMEQDMMKYNRMKKEELKSDKIDGIGILHYRFDQMKCRYFKQYTELQYAQLRSVCGSKTEKFIRQLLGNIWPISELTKNCDTDLFHLQS